MLNELINSSFIDLLPPNLRDDPSSIAAGKAVDAVFDAMLPKITSNVLIYSNIDHLGHKVLDVLAPDLHVDVYDKNWSLDKKRQVCKNSPSWHLYKGTPFVLEDVAKSLIGSCNLSEWYEYGGIPYHFKILFNVINEELDQNKITELNSIAEEYKNLRSKMDGLEYQISMQSNSQFIALTTLERVIFVKEKE